MTKIETITEEYNHCGECWHAGDVCNLTDRKIPDMWGKIPSWCPLPDKETDKDKLIKKGDIKNG